MSRQLTASETSSPGGRGDNKIYSVFLESFSLRQDRHRIFCLTVISKVSLIIERSSDEIPSFSFTKKINKNINT